MKRGGVTIYLSNRLLYTIIFSVIILLTTGIVYAVGSSSYPNPGHNISSIGSPAGCTNGQFLQWTGTDWTCASSGGGQWTGNVNITGNLTVRTGGMISIGTGFISNVNTGLFVNASGRGVYSLSGSSGGIGVYGSGQNGIYGISYSTGGYGGYFYSDTGYALATGGTGKVGIGTDTPTQKLEVAGNAKIDGNVSASNINADMIKTNSAGSGPGQSFYDFGANHIGGNTIYSYGAICSEANSGDCSGGGGTVINGASISTTNINGAAYHGFGGMYSTSSNGYYCYWPNPLVGGCSCPSGYTRSGPVLRGSDTTGSGAAYLYFCSD